MKPVIKPRALRTGDLIGVCSPSSGIESGLEDHFDRGKRLLSGRGYRLLEAPHTRDWKAHYSSDADTKVADFMSLVRNPEVSAILPTLGGTTAYQLLATLPYDEIGQHPKVIFGFSDNSLQACVIAMKSNLVTFHGHSDVVFGLGDLADEEKTRRFALGGRYTSEQFFGALEGRLVPGPVQKATDWRVLRGGAATGRLIVGNLDVLQILHGTAYSPDWRGAIFAWEAAFVELNRVDLMLAALELTGVLAQIAGMVVGKGTNLDEKFFEKKHETLDEMILRHCKPYNFPIIVDADLGHDMECCVLPMGVRARMEGDTLYLLESPYGALEVAHK